MSFYSCTSATTHAPTDQRWLVGCRACLVQRYSDNTSFFRPKHLPDMTNPPVAGATRFMPDPTSSRVIIETTGETFILDSPEAFIHYWMTSERAALKWNTRHQKPNIIVPQVEYGITGSGTTMLGSLTSEVTGLVVADALGPNAHPFPVNPKIAARDLEAWQWRCTCGAFAPQASTECLACRQRRATTFR